MDVWVSIRLWGGLISDVKVFKDIHNARADFLKFVKSREPVDLKEAKLAGRLVMTDEYMTFLDTTERHDPEIRITKKTIFETIEAIERSKKDGTI